MNQIIRSFIESRGYTHEFLDSIECGTYPDLKDLDLFSEILHKHFKEKNHIVILPDFDMDGIAAGSLGYAALSEMGFVVSLYIPKPELGYGFDETIVDDLLEKHNKFKPVKAIITCDTGVTCYSGANYIKSKGLDLLITDHHLYQDPINCDVLIDPTRPDDPYPNKAICGAFVLYQALMHYARHYTSPTVQEKIERLQVLAGLGTVSDGMPILYENRKLVRDAIDICRMLYDGEEPKDIDLVNFKGKHDNYSSVFKGLFALFTILENGADPGDKIRQLTPIDSDTFGFYIAPLFNAVKRLDGDLSKTYTTFFSDSVESASTNVRYMYRKNEERKAKVVFYMNEFESNFEAQLPPHVYVTDAPKGVLGLLAQQLILQTHLPTFVVNYNSAEGRFQGSGRCPDWYPGVTRLKNFESVVYASGHEGAFGVGFTDKELFFKELVADIEKLKSEIEIPDSSGKVDYTVSTFDTDAIAFDPIILWEYIYKRKSYQPFGRGFESPVGKLQFKKSDCEIRQLGKEGDHLKFLLPFGISAICWSYGHIFEDLDVLDNDTVFEIVGDFSVNVFKDVETLQFTGNLVSHDF